MKKYFMLLAAAATVLAVSCSKGKNQPADPTPNVVDEIDDTTPQPVLFGVNNAVVKSSISTKAAVDAWSATLPDSLYVLGLHNNGTDVLINNVGAKAPATSAGRDAINVYNPDATAANEPFYYGMGASDVYSFYGYYVGEAYKYQYNTTTKKFEAITTPAVPAKPTLDADYKLTVEFDGTTDIMLAKTDKEADLAARDPQYASKYVAANQIYSAKAARRGVHPDLIFEHKLSRFVFYLQAANAQVAAHIKLDSLTLGSKYKATLDVDGNVIQFENDTIDFVLKNNLGAKVTNQALVYNADGDADVASAADYTQVGESIMVAPGQENYYLKLGLKSDQITAAIPVTEQKIDLSELIAGAATDYKAEPGKKYVVKMMVYGPEAVQISVTLVPWDEVDMTAIDPDNDTADPRLDNVITVTTPAGTAFAINVGDDYQIEATSTNTGKKIIYTSSNPSIVTVDEDGLVHGVAAGTATITLSQPEDFDYKGAAPVVLNVTVS